ncbi:SIR2 family NAD-dependent protein deacylase [Maribacter polysaccharolyticus]|uniref:SIR2 family NAD-dependent protein deacylase n=1 Tax=Maribacter polysaccharolyticus TaxID=3020831 RepID=UPI00237F0C12|nr:NAD-dependent deacylase [Maribacter polysaccharolyticus]MDE3740718.1 NAD-dependent deacylase [Maribacter polysaccharolyticus]
MKKNVVILTGAGMSAESGLKTFRDADGLWEGHDVMEVASPQGFENNPELVLDFYNQRRRQLLEVTPNKAHKALVTLEEHFKVTIITQNVDDLHERAGSSHVVHLHGELLKVRSTMGGQPIPWRSNLVLGDTCEKGYQLRPHIVWFGEEVPMMGRAMELTAMADFLLIIGTSMQVYPAAGLIDFVPKGTPIYFVDPKPSIKGNPLNKLYVIPEKATEGVPTVVADLIDKAP